MVDVKDPSRNVMLICLKKQIQKLLASVVVSLKFVLWGKKWDLIQLILNQDLAAKYSANCDLYDTSSSFMLNQ